MSTVMTDDRPVPVLVVIFVLTNFAFGFFRHLMVRAIDRVGAYPRIGRYWKYVGWKKIKEMHSGLFPESSLREIAMALNYVRYALFGLVVIGLAASYFLQPLTVGIEHFIGMKHLPS